MAHGVGVEPTRNFVAHRLTGEPDEPTVNSRESALR